MKILFFVLMPFISKAQLNDSSNNGIHFNQSISWQQVRDKAKAENKYIFVDCFTTWCGPCKMMEKKIYPQKEVGDFFNQKFISIKVQMDQTPNDGSYVKSWYNDAKFIDSEYQIRSYPTFLFFNPEGKLVHRASRSYDANEFIELASNALNPKKQYYTLITEFKKGELDSGLFKQLAQLTKDFGDKTLANQIGDTYLAHLTLKDLSTDNLDFLKVFNQTPNAKKLAKNYIMSLNSKQLYTLYNIEFVRRFTFSSEDIGFNIFYNHSEKINKIMSQKKLGQDMIKLIANNDYAQSFIRDILYNEEFVNLIFLPAMQGQKIQPRWDSLKNRIKEKYKKVDAQRIVMTAQVSWYQWKKDWPMFSKYLISFVQNYGQNLGFFELNNMAWSIFEHSNKVEELNTAILWSKKAISLDSNYVNSVDTYANLLYKVGRQQEAIDWETKAVNMEEENSKKNSVPVDKSYKETLAKMLDNKKTWSE